LSIIKHKKKEKNSLNNFLNRRDTKNKNEMEVLTKNEKRRELWLLLFGRRGREPISPAIEHSVLAHEKDSRQQTLPDYEL
jgi:hypothetical protein